MGFSGGSWQVGTQASQIYTGYKDYPAVLLVNLDLTNTVYVGGDASVKSDDIGSIQIPPLGSVTLDGQTNLWAVCPTATVQVQVIPGGVQWSPSPAEIAEQIAITGINVNVTNFEITPTGDTSGVKDTSALTKALLQPGASIQLSPGTFYFSASSPFILDAQRVFGSGSGQTVIQLASTWTASYVFQFNGNSCQVDNLTILGGPNTSAASNPSITAAIEIAQSAHSRVNDLFFQYVNGYVIEATSGAAFDADDMISNIVSRNCDAGIHLQGNTSSSFHGELFLHNLQIQQCGSAATGHDALFIEDIEDVLVSNINVGMASGATGAAIHVKGNCATVSVVNPDVGGNAGPTVLIEDNAGSTGPSDVKFANGTIQDGTICLSVTGHASRLKFIGISFERANTHGVSIAGSGFDIDLENCLFNVNGRGASGTNYDLNWQSGPTGKVVNCEFNTSVTSVGVAGVQAVTNFGTNNQGVEFTQNAFNGSGSSGKQFGGSNLPTPIRFNKNYNPVGFTGNVSGSSPQTVTATNYDLNVIFQAQSGGIVIQVNGVEIYQIPGNGMLSLFVPVGGSVEASWTGSLPTIDIYGV